jgi:hypothetical protein
MLCCLFNTYISKYFRFVCCIFSCYNNVLRVRIPLRGGVFDTTVRYKVRQWLGAGRWFSPGTPVSSTNKTDRHDIAEILLKVTLNTITLTHTHSNLWFRKSNIILTSSPELKPNAGQIEIKSYLKAWSRRILEIHVTVFAILWRLDLYNARYIRSFILDINSDSFSYIVEGPTWLWLYASWIINDICNQCLSSLKLWVRTPFTTRCTRYNIVW